MKIVMTLLAGADADVVDHQLRYHLERGIDEVVATDRGSVDGTTEVLRSHEREGHLHLTREEGGLQPEECVTRMARFASEQLGADWVINSEAHEFWWPRLGSIRETLEAVPARFGVVRALVRNFVARPETPEPFYERMTVRHAAVLDRDHVFGARVTVAHRGAADVVVARGSHDAHGDGLVLIREWFPFEALRFPSPSTAQQGSDWRGGTPVDDDELARGIAGGSLAVDQRVRDALRGEQDTLVPERERFAPESQIEAERAFVADVAAFMETDSADALRRRVDSFDRRLARLEHPRRASWANALRRITPRSG